MPETNDNITPAETTETETVDPITCDHCGNDVACTSMRRVYSVDSWGDRVSQRMEICEDCEDSLVSCDSCGNPFMNGDGLERICGSDICPACRSAYYYSCESCGDWVHVDDAVMRDDYAYCEGCAPAESPNDERINSYSYRPKPVFYGKGPLFFGCELEVNYVDERIEEAVDYALDTLGEDHVYLKEDGSLTNGFEIVTHPHSFEELCNLWREFKPSHRLMTSAKSGECGFHVHVSRKALTRLQIQKLVVFINAPENAALVDKVAQRSNNGYCQKKSKALGHCGHSTDRYEAINLCNENTIEYRIFNGNTRPERILKNIEFVHATIHWVNTVSYRELTSTRFIEYVTKRRKLYPNLVAFLSDEKEEKTECA